MVRFFRQRNRVIGALATPLVFWLLLGAGLNNIFRAAGVGTASEGVGATPAGYLEYFYPGTILLMVLFTAIFSTISVIEDRREGFLQGILVSPAPRAAIVLGKVLGGASIAAIQGVLMLMLWPLLGPMPGAPGLAAAVGVMFVVGMGLTALGLCIAWPMDSTAGYHAVMNLLLMPMWFLSGAVFPISEAPPWLRAVCWINPLSYGQAAFSHAMTGGRIATGAPVGPWIALAVTVGFTALMLVAAVRLVERRRG